MSLAIGLDIGAQSITAVGIRQRGGALFLDSCLHLGDEEVGQAAGDPTAMAQLALARLSERGIRSRRVVIGVSGKDAIIRYSHLPPMPDWRLELLIGFEISEVAEKTGEALSSDFHILQEAEGGGSLVLVALAKDARVKETVDALEAVGIGVTLATPQPVAVGDCYRFLGDDSNLGITLVVDIGDGSTELAVVDHGELIFARSVAMGVDNMVRALSEGLSLSEPEARSLLAAGGAGQDDESMERALGSSRDQLAAMVAASVGFARQQIKRKNLDVNDVVISGIGARAPGLIEAIGDKIGRPAKAFNPMEFIEESKADRASQADAAEHGPECATAAGLALAQLLPGAVKLNLLPNEVKEKLEFKERTLWLYAGAGILAAAALVSLGLSFLSASAQEASLAQLKGLNSGVQARAGEHEELLEQNDSRQRELNAMAARARPGLYFSSLLATIGDALPQEVTFDAMRLAPGEERASEGPPFVFEIEARADDSQSRGTRAIEELQEAIKGNPLVEGVKFEIVRTDKDIEFRLDVTPVIPKATGDDDAEANEGEGNDEGDAEEDE